MITNNLNKPAQLTEVSDYLLIIAGVGAPFPDIAMEIMQKWLSSLDGMATPNPC